ncbi:MAG: glycosyltransferase family 2 protein [Paludibacteraceae bacterium]|nr:glycosyltransferase family 2 protein [Paludibacteraceae bacterium]
MKLLSIIIPTYNMEALLPRCLDSLVSAQHADVLDVLVVNDGSKDASSAIGHDYEERYPGIVTVIDKPNGNYGSTINAGMLHAKGKYVKVLDSDDWFDTSALDKMLEALVTLQADMIVTHFSQLGPGSAKEVVRYNTMGREPYEYGRVYDLDAVLKDEYIRFFLMHALAYRTELLREIAYQQTEGISYTDTEWATLPVFHATSICFLNLNVYQYNLDRGGQTMAPEVLMRSIPQLEKVNRRLVAYYREHKDGLSAIRSCFMKQYYENRMRILYKLYLLDMPRKDFRAEDLQRMDDELWLICKELGLLPVLYPENKLLRFDYIKYWHKYHRRWPRWFECFNHCVDVVVKWLYVHIFRR